MLADILGVIIGVFFIYLLLSLLISTFVEWLSRRLGWRAHKLSSWLQQLLDEGKTSSLSRHLYDHPLIRPLVGEGKLRLPPNIPPKWFTIALIDIIRRPDSRFPDSIEELKQVIRESQTCPDATRNALIAIAAQAGNSLKDALDGISLWFEGIMQSLRQAYKSMIQQRIFVASLLVAALLNIDTISVCDVLWSDSQVRHTLRLAAEQFLADVESDASEEISSEALAAAMAIIEMSELRLPIWWSLAADDPRHIPRTPSDWVLKILGLTATALATSLGAPFWFDLLRKIISFGRVRSTAVAI